jgi:hypothetical protein
MPVIDGDGRIAGVVSEADVLPAQRSEPERRASGITRVLGAPNARESWSFDARVVSDAVTSITTKRYWPVAVASQRRVEPGVNRLLVTLQQQLWRDEQPVGIRTDACEVRLSGELRNRDETEILGKMNRTVPGDVGVSSGLTGSEQDWGSVTAG